MELDQLESGTLGHPSGDFVGDVGRGHAQLDHVWAVHPDTLQGRLVLEIYFSRSLRFTRIK